MPTRPLRRWSALALVVLAACAATPQRSAALDPLSPTRLPTVTPYADPTRAPTIAPIILSSAPSATPVPPSPTPGVQQTADGPVTASMARLRLGGETTAALGDPEAPITVVEFADFGCEFCRMFHVRTFRQLKAAYIDTGKVYFVYKDLPVVSPQGALAAQAAACAGDQGAYWAMHDQLFFEPEAWSGSDAQALSAFAAYAGELALDGEVLRACVAEGRYAAHVQRDFEEAQRLRIFGTPAFFINGKLLGGAQPFEVWDEILREELGT
ncbi:thioredoxin domain-containing protein [Chloroflexales bacterium ZM16-3]|nr:thioredoxin domain-containing protein [Chloroflexales bacterium ZM16-3]